MTRTTKLYKSAPNSYPQHHGCDLARFDGVIGVVVCLQHPEATQAVHGAAGAWPLDAVCRCIAGGCQLRAAREQHHAAVCGSREPAGQLQRLLRGQHGALPAWRRGVQLARVPQ